MIFRSTDVSTRERAAPAASSSSSGRTKTKGKRSCEERVPPPPPRDHLRAVVAHAHRPARADDASTSTTAHSIDRPRRRIASLADVRAPQEEEKQPAKPSRFQVNPDRRSVLRLMRRTTMLSLPMTGRPTPMRGSIIHSIHP